MGIAVFAYYISPVFADWTHDPNLPVCTITFPTTTTVTASSSNGNITSLSKNNTAVTTIPTPPAASVTYTWTPTANSTFTAKVSNANGNTNTCTNTYSCPAVGTESACLPPPPTVSPLSCVSTATYTTNISWTAPNVSWVDISSSTTDTLRNVNYSHKDVTGTSTTEAPTGFGTYTGEGVSSFTPATIYYARIFNGVNNSSWTSFSRSACSPRRVRGSVYEYVNNRATLYSGSFTIYSNEGGTISTGIPSGTYQVSGLPYTPSNNEYYQFSFRIPLGYQVSSTAWSGPSCGGLPQNQFPCRGDGTLYGSVNLSTFGSSRSASGQDIYLQPLPSSFPSPSPSPSPSSSPSPAPVNGGWTPWEPLTCPAACSNYTQTKYCASPAPSPIGVGLECLKDDGTSRAMIETKPCGTKVCITPWIQVTGDVHSNIRINAPGGP